MIDCCSEPDVEFAASQFTNAHQYKRNECFCYRATLDELLADDVMEPVLRTAGYEPNEFRDMITDMAWTWARRNQSSMQTRDPNGLPLARG